MEQGQQIVLTHDTVLKMIGEREVRIAFLTDQLGKMAAEIQRLSAPRPTGPQKLTLVPPTPPLDGV